MHLKMLDSDKVVRTSGQAFLQHRESTIANMFATMKQPWMSRMLGEAIILSGSGSVPVSAIGCSHAAPHCVVPPDAEMWKDYRIRACMPYPTPSGKKNATLESILVEPTSTCCMPQNYWLADGNNEERLLLQQLAIGWFGEAIPRYERAHGYQFDFIVMTRPDAVWWKPVRPWCEWNWNVEMVTCDGPACDMAWFAPRRHLVRLTGQHIAHRNCPKLVERVRGRAQRHVCCTTSEHLLSFTRKHRREGGNYTSFDQIPAANFSIPLLKGMSVMRAVTGVCSLALHGRLNLIQGKPTLAAGQFAFKQQQKNGLLIMTLTHLRALFVRNETLAGRSKNKTILEIERQQCEAALSFYGVHASAR